MGADPQPDEPVRALNCFLTLTLSLFLSLFLTLSLFLSLSTFSSAGIPAAS